MATTRRTFTAEFKAQAVKLVTEQKRSFVEVSRDLDIGESTLRNWRRAIATSGGQAFDLPHQLWALGRVHDANRNSYCTGLR